MRITRLAATCPEATADRSRENQISRTQRTARTLTTRTLMVPASVPFGDLQKHGCEQEGECNADAAYALPQEYVAWSRLDP
jgi:hypothetical protein